MNERPRCAEEWNSAEAPPCRGSSQWIDGCVDKSRSGFGEEDDSNTGEVGERENFCWCSRIVRRKVEHDAWMNDLFWGRNLSISAP